MRLFLAVEIDKRVREEVAALSARLRQEADRVAPRARLTWVRASHVHLTLAFMGQVDEAAAARVDVALSAPLSHAPFDLTFGGVGRFPARGPARIIWIGIRDGADALTSFESRLGTSAPPEHIARRRTPMQ